MSPRLECFSFAVSTAFKTAAQMQIRKARRHTEVLSTEHAVHRTVFNFQVYSKRMHSALNPAHFLATHTFQTVIAKTLKLLECNLIGGGEGVELHSVRELTSVHIATARANPRPPTSNLHDATSPLTSLAEYK